METRASLPGIDRGRKLPKLGYRGIDTGEIGFSGYSCDAAMSLVAPRTAANIADSRTPSRNPSSASPSPRPVAISICSSAPGMAAS